MTTEPNEAERFRFELPIEARAEDIDVMRHVNNVVYLRWVQDIAAAHWFAVVTPDEAAQYGWVALRHEIDYLRPAFLGDALLARTWVGEANGAKCERFVEIWRPADPLLLAKSRSVWCLLHAESGRPRRMDATLYERFYRPPANRP